VAAAGVSSPAASVDIRTWRPDVASSEPKGSPAGSGCREDRIGSAGRFRQQGVKSGGNRCLVLGIARLAHLPDPEELGNLTPQDRKIGGRGNAFTISSPSSLKELVWPEKSEVMISWGRTPGTSNLWTSRRGIEPARIARLSASLGNDIPTLRFVSILLKPSVQRGAKSSAPSLK
jgi:hypothetical protein